MSEFYNRNIIPQRFNVGYSEGESGIDDDIIIVNDLMVQLGILVEFKHQVLQWYGATAPMK